MEHMFLCLHRTLTCERLFGVVCHHCWVSYVYRLELVVSLPPAPRYWDVGRVVPGPPTCYWELCEQVRRLHEVLRERGLDHQLDLWDGPSFELMAHLGLGLRTTFVSTCGF